MTGYRTIHEGGWQREFMQWMQESKPFRFVCENYDVYASLTEKKNGIESFKLRMQEKEQNPLKKQSLLKNLYNRFFKAKNLGIIGEVDYTGPALSHIVKQLQKMDKEFKEDPLKGYDAYLNNTKIKC